MSELNPIVCSEWRWEKMPAVDCRFNSSNLSTSFKSLRLGCVSGCLQHCNDMKSPVPKQTVALSPHWQTDARASLSPFPHFSLENHLVLNFYFRHDTVQQHAFTLGWRVQRERNKGCACLCGIGFQGWGWGMQTHNILFFRSNKALVTRWFWHEHVVEVWNGTQDQKTNVWNANERYLWKFPMVRDNADFTHFVVAPGCWKLLLASVSHLLLTALTSFSAVFLENRWKISIADISASKAAMTLKPMANESSWQGLSSGLGVLCPRVRLRVEVAAPPVFLSMWKSVCNNWEFPLVCKKLEPCRLHWKQFTCFGLHSVDLEALSACHLDKQHWLCFLKSMCCCSQWSFLHLWNCASWWSLSWLLVVLEEEGRRRRSWRHWFRWVSGLGQTVVVFVRSWREKMFSVLFEERGLTAAGWAGFDSSHGCDVEALRLVEMVRLGCVQVHWMRDDTCLSACFHIGCARAERETHNRTIGSERSENRKVKHACNERSAELPVVVVTWPLVEIWCVHSLSGTNETKTSNTGVCLLHNHSSVVLTHNRSFFSRFQRGSVCQLQLTQKVSRQVIYACNGKVAKSPVALVVCALCWTTLRMNTSQITTATKFAFAFKILLAAHQTNTCLVEPMHAAFTLDPKSAMASVNNNTMFFKTQWITHQVTHFLNSRHCVAPQTEHGPISGHFFPVCVVLLALLFQGGHPFLETVVQVVSHLLASVDKRQKGNNVTRGQSAKNTTVSDDSFCQFVRLQIFIFLHTNRCEQLRTLAVATWKGNVSFFCVALPTGMRKRCQICSCQLANFAFPFHPIDVRRCGCFSSTPKSCETQWRHVQGHSPPRKKQEAPWSSHKTFPDSTSFAESDSFSFRPTDVTMCAIAETLAVSTWKYNAALYRENSITLSKWNQLCRFRFASFRPTYVNIFESLLLQLGRVMLMLNANAPCSNTWQGIFLLKSWNELPRTGAQSTVNFAGSISFFVKPTDVNICEHSLWHLGRAMLVLNSKKQHRPSKKSQKEPSTSQNTFPVPSDQHMWGNVNVPCCNLTTHPLSLPDKAQQVAPPPTTVLCVKKSTDSHAKCCWKAISLVCSSKVCGDSPSFVAVDMFNLSLDPCTSTADCLAFLKHSLSTVSYRRLLSNSWVCWPNMGAAKFRNLVHRVAWSKPITAPNNWLMCGAFCINASFGALIWELTAIWTWLLWLSAVELSSHPSGVLPAGWSRAESSQGSVLWSCVHVRDKVLMFAPVPTIWPTNNRRLRSFISEWRIIDENLGVQLSLRHKHGEMHELPRLNRISCERMFGVSTWLRIPDLESRRTTEIASWSSPNRSLRNKTQ